MNVVWEHVSLLLSLVHFWVLLALLLCWLIFSYYVLLYSINDNEICTFIIVGGLGRYAWDIKSTNATFPTLHQ